MKKNIIVLLFLFLVSSFSFSQSKKPLDHTVYAGWKDLKQPKISDDGKWVSYEINPMRGDGYLYLIELSNMKKDSFPRAKDANFSPNSNFVIFRISPPFDTLRNLKIAKKKSEDLPKDTGVVLRLTDYSFKKFPNIKSIKDADENSNWIVIHYDKEPKKDTTKNKINDHDSSKIDTAKKIDTLKSIRKKDSSKEKKEGTDLVIYNPITEKEYKFTNIQNYEISKKGNNIYFTSIVKDSVDTCYIYIFNTIEEKSKEIFKKPGDIKSLSFDTTGRQLVFLYSPDTSKIKIYNLLYWNEKNNSIQCLIDTLNKNIAKDYCISESYSPFFSEDGTKILFGVSEKPDPEPKDTLLPEEKAVLDLWSWTDDVLQPQQLKELSQEKRKSLLYIYHLKNKSIVQLADSLVSNVAPTNKGNSPIFLGKSFKYRKEESWDRVYNDFYSVDVKTGQKKLLITKQDNGMLSPEGKYFVYYKNSDSSWHAINIQNNSDINLTKNLPACFYNKLNDVPQDPQPIGVVGFTKDSKQILIYDYYDIWVIDPLGKEKPFCLTNNYGNKNQIQFKYNKFRGDEVYIDLDKPLFLKSFDTKTKKEGFWLSKINSEPKLLIEDNYRFSTAIKAKNADILIWQKGNFTNYPELYVSDINFKNEKVLSCTNPQQKEYLWGTVEPVSWYSPKGEILNGLLYKPEDFDSTKKYPMLIYFYERNSQNINQYIPPSPSRSVINIPYFISNGYLVFVPDITYTVGYPGQSAFDAVVSGALAMISKGYVNKDKIGIQGQSWGGYQVAYLVTRTNMFAAAGAGAPVANMISAYGGIRWGTGMSRMFQYEKTQSRIGGTLWEKPLHFIENSPIFYIDKVTTPILITHNDQDDAVPWYQGIEFFTALRRLNKPAWFINYNNDAHNLNDHSWGNRIDLSIRLGQFFDHYLKDKPMPKWMKEGIPAIKKGKEYGYELE
ncbi:MAG TPA: prolyl oligopeptidase family serine peptidase [Bacteroidota bacterium]|nr:prolyl oligopeptidase family serine peptidase [Bacteroidota bacterium]